MLQGAPVLVDDDKAAVVIGAHVVPPGEQRITVAGPGWQERVPRERIELLTPTEAEGRGMEVIAVREPLPQECRGTGVIPHQPVGLHWFRMGVAQIRTAMCGACQCYFHETR